jgi:hypothetical protein
VSHDGSYLFIIGDPESREDRIVNSECSRKASLL